MASWEELGITKYPQYFNSRWWWKLKDSLIFSNPDAKCFVCQKPVVVIKTKDGKRSNLLPHHISYKHLGDEIEMIILPFLIWGDIVVVCYSCHTKIHFWKLFGLIEIKTPLNTPALLRRMFYLKAIFCVQNWQFGASLLSFCGSILV
jgi:hypothetical protein